MQNDPWVKYDGERGGSGWQNNQTGEIRYQEAKPTDRGEASQSQGQQNPKAQIPRQFVDKIKFIGSIQPTPDNHEELTSIKERANIAVRTQMAADQEKSLVDNLESNLNESWNKLTPDASPEVKGMFLKAATVLFQRTKAFIKANQDITGNGTDDIDKVGPILKQASESLKKISLIWDKYDQIDSTLQNLKGNKPIDVSDYKYLEDLPEEYRQDMPIEPEEPDEIGEPDKPDPDDYEDPEYYQEELEQYQQELQEYKQSVADHERWESDHDKWETALDKWETATIKKLERQQSLWEKQIDVLEDRLWNAQGQRENLDETFQDSIKESVSEILSEFEYTYDSIVSHTDDEMDQAYSDAEDLASDEEEV